MARPPKKGLPPWMATFSDLSILLLTFFVLLLTFANMDLQKFKDMLGSVQNAFGVDAKVRGKFQPTSSEESGPERYPAPKPQPSAMPVEPDSRSSVEAARMARQVHDFAKAAGLTESMDVSSGPNGVRLRVKGQLLFEPGEANVKPAAKTLLENVAKVMRKFNFYLTVEGHTDDRPINTQRFPSNWELSAARAAAVLRYLITLGIPRDRVSAVGYADNYPLASNSNAEGRERNRRVEFIFTRQPLRADTS